MNKSPPSFIGDGKTFYDELIIRGIKLVDICYLSSIYFTLGYIISRLIDNWMGTFDEKKADKKSMIRLYIEVVLHFSLLGILTYFARNIVEQVPFPMNGIHGYTHSKLKEIASASLFVTILVLFQTHLRTKLLYLSDRITKKVSKTPQNEANVIIATNTITK